MTAGGVCKDTQYSTNGPPNFETYPAAWPTSTNPVCTTQFLYSYQAYSEQYMQYFTYSVYDITSGVCSTSTLTKLATTSCQNELTEQPNFVYTTLNNLLFDMCVYADIPAALISGRRRRRSERKTPSDLNLRRVQERDFLKSLGKPSPLIRSQTNVTTRLAPIGQVSALSGSQNIARLAPISLATTASGTLQSTNLKWGKLTPCVHFMVCSI